MESEGQLFFWLFSLLILFILDVNWFAMCGRTVHMTCSDGNINVIKALHRRVSGCGFSLPFSLWECIKDVVVDLSVCQGSPTCKKDVPAFTYFELLGCATSGYDFVEVMYACI